MREVKYESSSAMMLGELVIISGIGAGLFALGVIGYALWVVAR